MPEPLLPTRPIGLAAPLAYVGDDEQLHVVGPGAATTRPVTFPVAAGRLWGGGAPGASTWPVWSPDQRWLACFQSEGPAGETPTQVAVSAVDGVEERVLLRLERTLPVHLQWSPDGQHLALLVQFEDVLQLWTCPLAGGRPRLIDEGAPLFFGWRGGGAQLFVHTGSPTGGPGRLGLRAVGPTGEDDPMDDVPGSFTSPHAAGRWLFYARSSAGGSELVAREGPRGEARVLMESEGLLAFLPDATGSQVAVSAGAASGERFDGLHVIDVMTGQARKVASGPLVAFTWRPTGGLVLCRPAGGRGGLRWTRLDLGEGDAFPVERRLALMRPTRDQLFQLRFFEQFMLSHPPISPDGAQLVWASYPTDPTDPRAGEPTVYVAALEEGGSAAQALGAGSYAVFPRAR